MAALGIPNMKKIRINREAYSISSKRSIGFEYIGDFYEDKKYRCKKCYKDDVFTAEEQKECFEVKKKYMWQQRFLCRLCYKEMCLIRQKLQIIDEKYQNDKSSVLGDEEILGVWLSLLKKYSKYYQKEDTSKINFVIKALSKA